MMSSRSVRSGRTTSDLESELHDIEMLMMPETCDTDAATLSCTFVDDAICYECTIS